MLYKITLCEKIYVNNIAIRYLENIFYRYVKKLPGWSFGVLLTAFLSVDDRGDFHAGSCARGLLSRVFIVVAFRLVLAIRVEHHQ